MTQAETKISENSGTSNQIKSIYLTGAIFAVIFLSGTVLDIIIGTITGGDLTTLPQNAVDRFNQFNQNALLGLYNLDFLNLINTIIMIPVFFALFTVHNRLNIPLSKLAMIIFIIGTTVFVATNTALPMLDLSHKYSIASTDSDRQMIASAGEALLARGSHGSPGVFIGFVLLSISNIIISIVMLKGKIFNKINSYLGIIGSLLLLLYLITVTFVPSMKNIAMILALPGGLIAMAWIIMFSIKLIKLSREII